MNYMNLTSEQINVVHHAIGRHAQVLAVAGSGKTSTMVFRIKYLIKELNVSPFSIKILMFNRAAKKDFIQKLNGIGLSKNEQPQVYTFHSLAYKFINEMIKQGIIIKKVGWYKNDELIWAKIKHSINQIDVNNEYNLDPDEVSAAISLWKGSLIPPTCAGYKGNELIPKVYKNFEEIRNRENALTFDDFIPDTVKILQTNSEVRNRWCNRINHLIVDEYQDVNYGQQKLIELLAGKRADVMVVGDDDQTIYEWRGARPSYIIRDFGTVFTNKPQSVYKLSHSFRFGPVIAQISHNLITCNTNRVDKQLIAHDVKKRSNIVRFSDESNLKLAEEIATLVKENNVKPKDIIILVRMYAQASGIEVELLRKSIPYYVVGNTPLFGRSEVRTLLNYISLGLCLNDKLSNNSIKMVLSTANKPSRRISRNVLNQTLSYSLANKRTIHYGLLQLIENSETPLNKKQKENFSGYINVLLNINKIVKNDENYKAHDLLKWLIEQIGYLDHFNNYYGNGEHSYERKEIVKSLIKFSEESNLEVSKFLEYTKSLDSKKGAPISDCITITSIFRTKGLEFDYVVIPDCNEGFIPYSSTNVNPIFDKKSKVKEPEMSDILETERRLFYVAITRAKNTVLLGTSPSDDIGDAGKEKNRPSRFIEEILIKETQATMESLQMLCTGDDSARDPLIENTKAYGGFSKISYLLLTHYLKDFVKDSIYNEVAEIIKNNPTRHFEYKDSYQNIDNIKKTNILDRAWDNVN